VNETWVSMGECVKDQDPRADCKQQRTRPFPHHSLSGSPAASFPPGSFCSSFFFEKGRKGGLMFLVPGSSYS